MYNSSLTLENKSQNQSQKDEWHNAYRWIQNCPPHCACQASFYQRGYCTSDYCKQHGQYQRIEKCNRILSLGVPTGEAYALTLPYGTALAPNRVATARRYFLKTLKYRCPQLGVLWRLHFVNFVPHLHMTILTTISVNDNRSKVKPHLQDLIKQIWTDALSLIGHSNPQSERVGVEYVDNYEAWIKYMFRTGKRLSANECPPKVPHTRWAFWGMDKAYKRHLQQDRVRECEGHSIGSTLLKATHKQNRTLVESSRERSDGESACSVGQRQRQPEA